MYEIRPWLFIGRYANTADLALLRHHQIGAMLQLAAPLNMPGIERLYLPVDDGVPVAADLLTQGVAFVRERKAAGLNVLVACGAGISRSTTFAVGVLHEEESLDLYDAYRDICEKHPHALPHPSLWQSLCKHYGVPMQHSLMNILRRLDEIRREHTP